MKNNYITLGLIFGAGIGISIDVLTNTISICLPIGAGVGLALGTRFENYVKGKKKNCIKSRK